MTIKLTRAAELRASSFNEADNSIEVVWTTGAPVRRRDWRNDRFYSEVLEVSPDAVRLDRLNAGASFLNSHNSDDLRSVIGSVVPGSAKIERGKGVARIRLSSAPSDADIVHKIRDSIIRSVSVGYAVHKVERTESDDGADDVWRVIDWEPFELSAVAVPADHQSQIREQPDGDNVVEFVQSRAALGDLDAETADVLRLAALSASVRADGETAADLAEFAYDLQFAKSRSTQLAGIAFGAALVMAGGYQLKRALADSNADTDQIDEDEAINPEEDGSRSLVDLPVRKFR